MLFDPLLDAPSLCDASVEILPLRVLDFVNNRLVFRESFDALVVERSSLLTGHANIVL